MIQPLFCGFWSVHVSVWVCFQIFLRHPFSHSCKFWCMGLLYFIVTDVSKYEIALGENLESISDTLVLFFFGANRSWEFWSTLEVAHPLGVLNRRGGCVYTLSGHLRGFSDTFSRLKLPFVHSSNVIQGHPEVTSLVSWSQGSRAWGRRFVTCSNFWGGNWQCWRLGKKGA
jgi:hypothetical protein